MPTKQVISPSKGMVTNLTPTSLDAGASPYINGCYLNNGEIISDYGYIPFPTPSTTQSNQLVGSVMTIKDFTLSSGIEFLLCFTTSYVYNWNTVTMTWDVINQGVIIDSADIAWTGSTNVTTTANNTIFIRGTHSSKNVIASAFTTGVISSHNFSSLDLSGSNLTNLSFWIYSPSGLLSDVIRLRISNQNTGGTGGIFADYTIPSIKTNTWTHCSILLSSFIASSSAYTPASMTAALSIALVAHTDPGSITVYIDDIQAVQCFQGTLDNRFSLDAIYDTLIITNGVDAPSQINSSLVHSTMTLNLPSGNLTTSEIVRAFQDHVLFFNNTENGNSVSRRCTWTNIGTTNDFVDGTSGFQDLTDNTDQIVAVEILSETIMMIYRENSISLCTWVGGHTPFRFDPLITGYGALSKDSVEFVEGYHVVIDNADVYVTNGTNEVQNIDAPIQQYLYNNLNGQYAARTFTRFSKIDNEVEFWICNNATTPDQGYTFNQINANWYIRSRNISGFGTYQTQTYLTIGELIGTIAQQNFTFGSQTIKSFFPITLLGDVNGLVYQINKTSTTNNGTSIPSEYHTPDFVLPDTPEFENKFMRVNKFVFDAFGSTVTVQYSIDGGITWNACQGGGTNVVTLTSAFSIYEQYFETNTNKIRFRFTGGPFTIRYFAFTWMLRSERR